MRPYYLLLLVSIQLLEAVPYTVTTNTDTLGDGGTGQVGYGTNGELRYGLNQLNEGLGGIDSIVFNLPSGSETIALNGILPPLNLLNNTLSLIDGTNLSAGALSVTITGGGIWPGFFVSQGNGSGSFQLQNLTLSSCVSEGGGGGTPGGGGGAGIGGALLIQLGNVTLSNVTFSNNAARGGSGGAGNATTGGGGGGGLYFAFGGSGGAASAGGGGGVGGLGGNVEDPGAGAGGGGGLAVRFDISPGPVADAQGGTGASTGSVGDAGGGFISPAYTGVSGGSSADGNAGGINSGGGGGGGSGAAGGGGGGHPSYLPNNGDLGGTGGRSGLLGGGGGGSLGDGGNALGQSGTTLLVAGGGGGATVGFQGGLGSCVGGGGAGTLPGNSVFLGGGGGALIGSGNPGGTSPSGGQGGSATNASGGGGGGGGAVGGAIGLLSGTIEIQGGGVFIDSSLLRGQGGTGLSAVNNGAVGGYGGQDLFANSNAPVVLNATGTNPNITFYTGLFVQNLQIEGTGVVSFAVNQNTPPPTAGDPNFYFVEENISINSGTLYLNGTLVIEHDANGDPIYTPIPVLSARTGAFTVQSGATLKASNGALASVALPLTIASGGILSIEPGFTSSTPVNFQSGSFMQSHISSSVAPTLFIEEVVQFAGTDLSPAELQITVDPNAASGVYTLLLLSSNVITSPFGEVLVNGAPGTVYYSPPQFPTGVLYPVGVPYGITTQNIFLGPISTSSLVLFDPCAGLVVIFLTNPVEQQTVLQSFFSNQCSITAQSLSNLTVSLNSQIVRQSKNSTQAQASGTPIAAWRDATTLVAQGSGVSSGSPSNRRSSEEQEKSLEQVSIASLFNSKKATPNYSLSLNTFGQFQKQDRDVTASVTLPAYDVSTGGFIASVDYIGFESFLLGGAATYAFTKVKQAQHLGTQELQSIFATAYAGFIFNHLTMDLLVTGSYNHNNAVRNFQAVPGQTVTLPSGGTFQATGIPGGTASATYNSYQLVPHFDLNYELSFEWISLLPFLTSDCAITLSPLFQERGAGKFVFSSCGKSASLNTITNSFTSILLQNEAGCNLFEQIDLQKRGLFVLRQKASYVNRYSIPYQLGTKFVGTEQFQNTKIAPTIQHFFGMSAEVVYRLRQSYLILTYEGMVGSGYLTNSAYIHIGQDF